MLRTVDQMGFRQKGQEEQIERKMGINEKERSQMGEEWATGALTSAWAFAKK